MLISQQRVKSAKNKARCLLDTIGYPFHFYNLCPLIQIDHGARFRDTTATTIFLSTEHNNITFKNIDESSSLDTVFIEKLLSSYYRLYLSYLFLHAEACLASAFVGNSQAPRLTHRLTHQNSSLFKILDSSTIWCNLIKHKVWQSKSDRSVSTACNRHSAFFVVPPIWSLFFGKVGKH